MQNTFTKGKKSLKMPLGCLPIHAFFYTYDKFNLKLSKEMKCNQPIHKNETS
jgi:hypothetical protein